MKLGGKLTSRFDFIIISAVAFLLVFGLLAIYSSTQNVFQVRNNFEKQLFALALSGILFTVIYFLPTTLIRTAVPWGYGLSIFLLLAVLVLGKTINGAKAWIVLGPLNLQPAEFSKIATLLALAAFLDEKGNDLDDIKTILKYLAIGLFPVALIMLQPDLGSSLVYFGMMLALLFWRGISTFGLFVVLAPPLVMVASLFGPWYIAGAFVIVAAFLFTFKKNIFITTALLGVNFASAFFVKYLFDILSPHQKKRILSFVDPNADPLGAGYNAIQAQIAIGSGGLTGKGFMSGNQTQLQFIPEQWSDFIFCVIGEEFGFVGTMLILVMFMVIFLRMLKIATEIRNQFLSLVVVGILSIFTVHFAINIGMVLGIMPVIGIPLPFVSYGGSSLLSNFIMLGIVYNIYRSRQMLT
ncbi:MAG: rod shape-determining protein RodA [Chlorobiota bacterium]|nr:MAG: rod shape-determining protein RodA [Chlorobiota bacterium]